VLYFFHQRDGRDISLSLYTKHKKNIKKNFLRYIFLMVLGVDLLFIAKLFRVNPSSSSSV